MKSLSYIQKIPVQSINYLYISLLQEKDKNGKKKIICLIN
ncbi:hypothetical protein HMPREF1002_04815 [Porphyromonas sp. 31_2]|nr:hypothetical protein HMPREF1002_04815 [Porphyromonas sp. 31_2]